MAYLSEHQLVDLGLGYVGKNVLISDKASIYDTSKIEIGDNSRIDDFCVISGKIFIGKNVHITPQCLIAGGSPGIVLESYTTYAYGVKIFAQSDDYSGMTMTNSTIASDLKEEIKEKVVIKKHSIIGAGSIIMPGVVVGVGVALGANSLLLDSADEWSIYVGSPARKLKPRKKDLLNLLDDE